MLVVQVQHIPRVQSWRSQLTSHRCSSLNSGSVVACSLCATTDAAVDVFAVHRRLWTSLWCRSDKFQLSVLIAGMLGGLRACTQVQGRGSCPQGHGPHN